MDFTDCYIETEEPDYKMVIIEEDIDPSFGKNTFNIKIDSLNLTINSNYKIDQN